MSMIYLIRHGQASFGHENYDRLSPMGRRQARILARHMLGSGFLPDAVYSGTMMRQKETAEEFLAVYRAEGKPLPEVTPLSAFDEYDTDSIVGALFSAMAAQDASLHEDRSRMVSSKDSFKRVFEGAMLRWVTGRYDTPGIETWEELKARVAGALQLITEGHGRGKTLAVFTSGGAIAASLAHVLGLSGEQAMRLNWQVVNTSVSRLMYNAERITLAGFNTIAHLELAGDPSLITYR
jgi:broad specificity phosphatase PhoE